MKNALYRELCIAMKPWFPNVYFPMVSTCIKYSLSAEIKQYNLNDQREHKIMLFYLPR